MKSILLLPFFFLLGVSSLFSQHLNVDGYIITIAGDSIAGQIELASPVLLCQYVLFGENQKSQQKYFPTDISAFGWGDGKTRYERLEVPVLSENNIIENDKTKTTFARLLESGTLKLWVVAKKDYERFFLLKNGTLHSFDSRLSPAYNYEILSDRIVFYRSDGETYAMVLLANLEDQAFEIHNSDIEYRILGDSLYRVKEYGSNYLRALIADCPEIIFDEQRDLSRSLLVSRVNKYNNCIPSENTKSYPGKANWQFSALATFGINNYVKERTGHAEHFGGTFELRRNDWLPTLSIGLHFGVTKGKVLEEFGWTNRVDYHLLRYKEQAEAQTYKASFQYHALPGKRLRPFGTIGLCHVKTTASLWTEEGLTEPDFILPGQITLGFVGGGVDYYLMDLIQFRLAFEWMSIMNFSAGVGINF